MSYTVYIILVTVIHGIYFTVQMGLDLFKDVNVKSEKHIETFDVSSVAQLDKPVEVNETSPDGSFTYGRDIKPQTNNEVQPSQLSEGLEENAVQVLQAEQDENSLYKNLISNAQNCVAVEVEYQHLSSAIEWDDAWEAVKKKNNIASVRNAIM